MEIKALKTRVFQENEDLISFILKYVKKLPEDSILVLSSKIVALAEGRTANNSPRNKKNLIEKESDFNIKNSWFSIKDNIIMPDAGIDESNAKGKLVLLPRDSYKSAEYIRESLKNKFKVKNLGVIITDSNFIPLRKGAIGIAIGYSGFKGIRNYIGEKDIFGRKLKYSTSNIPDSIATASALCMGEGKEQKPLVLVKDAPVEFIEKVNKKEMIMNMKKDIFYPLYKNAKIKKQK